MSDSELTFGIDTATAAAVIGARIDEALDRPFEAWIEIEVADPPETFLGQDAVVTWGRTLYSRRLCGIVRAVHTRGRWQDRAVFELEIAPALALLSLTRNTRMFQDKTVPEILDALLTEALAPYERAVVLDLREEYPRREYCMQYQESDLDFAHRLMQEEGISYSFDHAADREEIVLRDDNAAYGRVPQAADPIPFRSHADVIDDEEAILAFERFHDTTTTSVAIRDHDFSTPGHLVEDALDGEDLRGRVRQSFEHGWGRTLTIGAYDAGATRYQERDTPRQKRLRLEAHRAREITARGVSRVVAMVPGTTFALVDHPAVGMDGEYLIIAVRHYSDAPAGADESSESYYNELECIPLDQPQRPRRITPKPRIPSIQTAVVTGPAGEEIHTDEHGRIKVQFHWDRENADDEHSSWIRVQQKWAGAGWGFFWLPRIGMEVVVQFFDGDPDRPLVTGSVYDAANVTPYELPADKTKSTIKSSSSPGGDGFNEWRFEDAAGEEQVFTHAQRNYDEVVENDHSTEVGHDQTIQVDNNQDQVIHNNQTEDVSVDQTLTVDGDRSVQVEGSFDEKVDGTETRAVSGAVDETFDANETRDVAGNLTETLAATETRTIGGAQSESIAANRAVTIGAASSETVSAALSETVSGGITTSVGGGWTVTAAAGLNVTAAAGIELTLNGPVNISAPAGVMQVDGDEDKTAGFLNWAGALGFGGCGIKDETYGAAIAFTKVKVGGCVTALPAFGFVAELKSSKTHTMGMELKGGGATLKKWGLDSDG